MGTNYYLEEREPCPECGRPYDRRHIGKSSAGWCFGLHVHPDDRINGLEDWVGLWSKPEATISNEYGETLTPQQMYGIITDREWQRDGGKCPPGYSDWDHFHAMNHSQAGPEGLLRHRIDGRHCIGHGDGTWDLMVGEFS